MAIAYIGMGSNMENPEQQLINAKKSLQQIEHTELLLCSDLFKSKAMMMPDDTQPQADYINAVVKLETQLSPHQLLDQCQKIETRQGRVRKKKWGARTLDLDILLYDDLQFEDERLSIHHPGISKRDFVLYPLSQLEKKLVIPGQGECCQLQLKIANKRIHKLGALL